MRRVIQERGAATASLISIITAVIIISVIIGTIAIRTNKVNDLQKLDYMNNDISMLNEKIAVYYFKYKELPVKERYLGMGNIPKEQINPNDNGEYYVIDINLIENLSLNNNPNDPENIYVINAQSHTIYFPKGVRVDSSTYYRLMEQYSEIVEEMGPLDIRMTPSTTEWTKGPVTVTVNYPTLANTTKQYRIGTGSWTTYTSEVSVADNLTTVYARLINSTGQISTEENLTIRNIDRLAPIAFNLTTSTTTNSITVSGSTIDSTATTINGRSDIYKYQYKLDNGAWQDSNVFNNLVQGSVHTVSMKAIDNAGNETEATNKGASVTVGTIDAAGAITMTPSTVSWTWGPVTVTITYPTLANTTKQYKIGTGSWTTYTEAVSVADNGQTVYARIIDSINQSSTEKSLTISNIDRLEPNAFNLAASISETTITVTGGTTDAPATGTNACSGISRYQYKLNNGAWQDSNVFGGLMGGTSHTVSMKAIDYAGNEREAANVGLSLYVPLSIPGIFSVTVSQWGVGTDSDSLDVPIGSLDNFTTLQFERCLTWWQINSNSSMIRVLVRRKP